jgi:hypothetical protein
LSENSLRKKRILQQQSTKIFGIPLQHRRWFDNPHRSSSLQAAQDSQLTQDCAWSGIGKDQFSSLTFNENLQFAGKHQQDTCGWVTFLYDNFPSDVVLNRSAID